MLSDKLPKSWSDISIGQYIELRPYIEMRPSKVSEIMDINIEKLSILSGEKREWIADNVTGIELIGYVNNELTFLNNLPENDIPSIFKIKDRYFKATLYKEDMTAGQFMSVTELLKDSRENPDLVWAQLHYILVNVCIEVDKKGKPIKIESEAKWVAETARDFYDAFPFSIAYPIAVFFCDVLKILPEAIQDCLNWKVEKLMTEVKGDLEENGVGS